MSGEKSLYARYYEERVGGKCLERPGGFICYRVVPEAREVSIDELYVEPKIRQTGLARTLVEIAAQEGREARCNVMTCCVMTAAKTSGMALQAALCDGFNVISASGGVITLAKEI